MINEIKTIVNNYLSNMKLCSIAIGTVTDDGIRINEKLLIPIELVTGNLKTALQSGDRVRLLRDHGGQQYFILEVIVT
ncbi:MAG: helicase [Herbinix sp.]|jgi:hypothetical protein|nr:helicase [Herbinix sp.]